MRGGDGWADAMEIGGEEGARFAAGEVESKTINFIALNWIRE